MEGLGYARTEHRHDAAPERPRPSRRELWLTVGAIAVVQVLTVLPEFGNARNHGSVISPLMGLVATSLLLRHRTNLPAITGAVGLLSVGALVLYPQTVPGVVAAALITVHLVSARCSRRISWATTAGFAVLVAATAFLSVQEERPNSTQGLVIAALAACLVLGSWALGQLRRARAQEVDAIRERMHQADLGREQAEQIALLKERHRIAREMHDVISHSVSGLVALADGGRYAAAQDPETAIRALEEISRGGRETLGELRGVINTLRDPSGQPGGPLPGISDIADLVESTAARGLHVELRTEGRPRPVPASTGLAAYRLVQEGLTNVVKHAGLTVQATVTLTWHDDLTVEIQDNGGELAPIRIPLPRGGSGLVGMRERTEALSGTLETGPRPGGGFSVRAWIPLPAGPA